MNQKQTLKQLQLKLQSVYWHMSCTDGWQKQLLQNELQFLITSIDYLQEQL